MKRSIFPALGGLPLFRTSNAANATLAINAGGAPLVRGCLPPAAVNITGR